MVSNKITLLVESYNVVNFFFFLDYNTILEELSNLTSDFIPHPTRNTVKSIRRQRHRSGISTRCSSRCSHRSFHPSESEFTSEWTDNQSVSGARVVGVGVE